MTCTTCLTCLTCFYPRILISLGSYALACILASLHPHILKFMCPHLHPWILIYSGSCVLACNLISSHPLVLRLMYSVCLLVSSHPHILIFLRSCTLRACRYSHILISSGSSVRTSLGNWSQIKTMVWTKKRPLWKQIMTLANF